jgi:transcription termination factor Rho
MSGESKKRSRRRNDGQVLSVAGVLELHPKGYGFLRDLKRDLRRAETDPFVGPDSINRYGLRAGHFLRGEARQTGEGRGPRVIAIHDVDGRPPDQCRGAPEFDDLTPINPHEWLRLETGTHPLTTRVIDLLTPLGKGQRALIVAPPRTGKTVLLQHIGQALATNHPEVQLVVLLIDERPEEVTEMRRQVSGDVLASSLDREVANHVRLSQLAIQRCKRLAESGHDVLLLVDSITRTARAFNKWVGDSGRTMSGGVDVKALDIPKQLFASARAFEEGGSLTIVATALIDTGSRMDEVIFQEFKGTGNMELVLDRQLADRRIWPAIDVSQSGTRREEKLFDPDTLHAVTLLRRAMSTMNPTEAMENLTNRLAKLTSNREFLATIGGARALSA